QEGKVTGYLGIATDISELKTMETSLIAAKEKAESASESKSEFLANMSHEIRTPLNGVIGFTDLLMRTELNESQKNYMQTVYNSANSLHDLINDILDISKIEAGKLEINEERVDIIKLCEQTIDLFRHQAHAKELEILLNITPTLERYIWADGLRLKQIMMNLIGNAIKFTQKGEIEFKIAADESIEKTGFKTFTFSVRDTGIGIAPQNLDKIFYAFDQEDASTTRRFGGSGLGLTISNRLLEFMGSKLKVESTVDSGSVFYFNVEFKTDPLGNDQNKDIREINKVLVVDDNINNQDILKEMLNSVGIETQQASNGIEAMDVIEKENDYDLAIIDYHMPYLNGLELIKYIREDLNIAKEQLPILLLHSSGEDDLIHRKCRDYDVQFFRTKPIHMSDLFNLINQIGNPGSMKKIEELLAPAPQTDLTACAFKIMVAEDNPVNKHLTRTILQKIMPDVELIEVNNGQEAVDAYKERTIDLILMDIQMPILSGFEATTQIRALEKEMGREAIPIIALTAKTVKGERERCTSYGLDDYVTKPVILQTLKNVIGLHLADKIDGRQQYSNQN
ncbi:MAG: response regulator, partial [Leeuwenhoekiella sp.]